ncbi:SDR family oxidoreductase [Phenylobacterium sp. SCN 70-31]|uniref:SDR family oxidoreductase n=1 Tax=Phenylobacterium sp. SCN 70-31 TaxID=1660129 RepID=UPI00086C56AB|nr:SDR family oxidoreductase [Phenylobacterium sp. SCN 70-31]ODT85992.1 MAG: short chain dehydrogenase [Phenylobacterium sp. SCN 70-31]
MGRRGAALITGAARRIGRVLAATAARAGYDVALHVRAVDDDAEAAAGEVRGHGRKAALLTCDLRKESATVALVGEAEAELGPVTLLVNSASVFENDAFADMNRASWDLHLETNLRAPLVLAQAFARRLPTDRDGLIVNILDQRVWRPGPDFFTYTLSKSALWAATQMLARDLAPRIRVNGIGPGPVLASIHQDAAAFAAEAASTPLGRPVPPEDIGAALAYLIDARAVTGQMIAVDSGQHLS